MKTFQLELNPFDQRASAKIKFQGFAQGIPYTNGTIAVGQYIFTGGIDFDISVSDLGAAQTFVSTINNQTTEFYAEVDFDTLIVTVYCKQPGEDGNSYPISTTIQDAVIVFGEKLLGGTNVYYSEVFDYACLKNLEELEAILEVTDFMSTDLNSSLHIIVQRAIGDTFIDEISTKKGEFFLPVSIDPGSFNLVNEIQSIHLHNDQILGTKARFKIFQTGMNQGSRFKLALLAK